MSFEVEQQLLLVHCRRGSLSAFLQVVTDLCQQRMTVHLSVPFVWYGSAGITGCGCPLPAGQQWLQLLGQWVGQGGSPGG